MKKILTLLLLPLIYTASFAQKSFEGEVIYSIDVQSRIPGLSSEQLSAIIGNTQHYYMKGADYKNDYNGSYLSWELYLSKAKKVFFSKKSEDTIRWANSTIDQDTIYKAELKKNDTTILGYTCDKLTFNCKSGIQVYYFNRQFSVKPSLYTDHKEGNWYAFLKMSGSIALKEIIENKQMIFTITATSVEQKDIDDSIFQLPADKPISELPIRQ